MTMRYIVVKWALIGQRGDLIALFSSRLRARAVQLDALRFQNARATMLRNARLVRVEEDGQYYLPEYHT